MKLILQASRNTTSQNDWPNIREILNIYRYDIQIDAMTEAFATVWMPAEIGPNQQATLKCKVDTGAGGNVMPLRAFSKLFPR